MENKRQVEQLHIFSLDWDGCARSLGLNEADPEPQKLDISKEIDAYQQLQEAKHQRGIKYYIDSFEGYKCLAYGTSRQNLYHDRYQMLSARPGRKRDSVFKTLPNLAELWGIQSDPFLMEDIVQNRLPGESFEEIVNDNSYNQLNEIFKQIEEASELNKDAQQKIKEVFEQNKSLRDENDIFIANDVTKIAILYAQMQRAASDPKNQGKQITLYFIDDREDIIGWVKEFFQREPALIPKNVTLQIGRYAPQVGITAVTSEETIHGTGVANPYYANTVRQMNEKLLAFWKI
jgi:hypothetical protein